MFTVFPADIKISNTKQTLIGGGLRSKWGFKVYSVGIYSDIKLVNKLIKKYRDTISKKDLITDFTESKSSTKTLLLKFHREVAATDMSDALGDVLISKVGKEKSNKFSSFLLGIVDGDRLTKGSDLYITCKNEKLLASISSGSGDNGLSSNVSSEDKSDVQKFDYAGKNVKGLCMAIFEAYLGDTPVSQQAKEGFEQGFSDMIARDELNMILQM